MLPVPGSSPQRHARPTTTTGARPPGRERHGTDPGRVTAMVAARTEATTHPSPPPDTIRGRTHPPNGPQAASAGGTAKTIPSPTEKTIVTVETTATNQQPAPIPGDRKSATANQNSRQVTHLPVIFDSELYVPPECTAIDVSAQEGNAADV